MTLKYRFVVTYQTPQLKQLSEFMSCLDLGERVFCTSYIFTFDYTKDEKPISYFKEMFVKGMQHIGNTVLHIEGGKIE